MKKLIVYYSYSGNTEKLVNIIKDKIDCDVVEIKTVNKYSEDYETVVEEAKDEINNNYMPEIKDINIDLSKYNDIILATPVWWYTYAPAVNTFLHKYDLTGKNIIPLVTNGGFIGHTIKDIESASGGVIVNEVNLRFNKDKLVNEDDFKKWLDILSK